MTPWTEFTEKNLKNIPENFLGVFQLSRGAGNIAYVGRADENLRACIQSFLNKGYTHFQWVQVPWTKEGYEMHCRLFHHAGGIKRLDNSEHPYPPMDKSWTCKMSVKPAAMCDL